MSHNTTIETELKFVGTGKLDNGKTIEVHFKTDNFSIERDYLATPRIVIDPILNENTKTFVDVVEKSNENGLKINKEIADYSHLKKVVFNLLHIMSYEDKEKIVSALTNNGYVVGAELQKDSIGRMKGWKIDIYE